MAVGAYRVNSNWQEGTGGVTWNVEQGMSIDGTAAASASVGTELTWYQWNLTSAVQSWVAGNRAVPLSFELRGNEAAGQHERGFWSKDCSDSDCGSTPGQRPKLVISYRAPTPTPTFTPTPTATPAPGVRLTLINDPSGYVTTGNPITYTIRYQTVGDGDLHDVVITDRVPISTTPQASTCTQASSCDWSGDVITWSVGDLNSSTPYSVTWKADVDCGPSRPGAGAEASRRTPTPCSPINRGAGASWTYLVAGTPVPSTARSNETINGPRLYLPSTLK